MSIVLLIPFLLPVSALAAEVTWTYDVPGADCEGNVSEVVAHEAYISKSPIPLSSEKCSDIVNAVVGARRVDVVPDRQGKVSVELAPGEYFVRGRVSHANGMWSELGNQLQFVVAQDVVINDPLPADPDPVPETRYNWHCYRVEVE